MSQTKVKFTDTKFLVESAMMIAIATVLSELKIIKMPGGGGSATLASMLPVIIISYRYGLLKGVLVGLGYGLIQQLLGLSNFGWAPKNWYSVVTIVLLDYLIAFMVLGLGGILRGKLNSQRSELLLGSLLVCVLRFLCHFLSGISVWASWGILKTGTVIYSLSYNATYMVPETIILALVAWYLGGILDFTADRPTRFAKEQTGDGKLFYPLGILVLVIGVIADLRLLFNNMAFDDNKWIVNPDKEWQWWVAIIVISAICLAGGLSLIFYSKRAAGKAEESGK